MSPLHQFEINRLININLFGYDVSFTNSALFMTIAVLLMTILFGLSVRKTDLIPSRLQAFAEISYKTIADMIEANVGLDGLKYAPLVFGVFFFVLGGNLIGMVPYTFTYTSHIIVTFGLAFIVILFVTILGFFKHGLHFLKFFVPDGVPMFLTPIVVPIEIISYLSRPLSLAIRLFANMMAGHTMLKVFAGFSVSLGIMACWLPLVVNIALTGFEIMVACLQAYVFTILTCIYLNDALHMH